MDIEMKARKLRNDQQWVYIPHEAKQSQKSRKKKDDQKI